MFAIGDKDDNESISDLCAYCNHFEALSVLYKILFLLCSSKYTAGHHYLRHASVACVFCIIAHLFLSLPTHLFSWL